MEVASAPSSISKNIDEKEFSAHQIEKMFAKEQEIMKRKQEKNIERLIALHSESIAKGTISLLPSESTISELGIKDVIPINKVSISDLSPTNSPSTPLSSPTFSFSPLLFSAIILCKIIVSWFHIFAGLATIAKYACNILNAHSTFFLTATCVFAKF
ncbi:hypothetical protein PHYBLDRAFT_164145 [Phycomyces blakesleeanus NRRL 1555(-)]|uniref:Uncharacterized protein n=1 Tax=Phycomyces blakesleeanus (strain ATCC 8743b / DSM 1359 / FGSC 10004 / NBRC 33097 / NRRL 1555) TaxID=763407 RepID=A0A162UZW3_PHYB8|nr:hypothetical protein PHYBLDRAFT_164145 [Phycomyces blakesleeanus NRRL 1555(-)]OAD79063.1 hypothetical protein PHYBLDRAFT_164145 [Phycomyces blakesleeanus NRRL 1555(-)]|eukprot:XP_018297103.1 hypothetical protein PHYBLDRAFT_164145 [Phycomyces blakesleeanus NRRL 1555(-)]